MYQEKIIDAITGEVTIRDYTPEEIEATKAAAARFEAERKAAAEAEAKRKEIFDRLGLTPEEAALIFNG